MGFKTATSPYQNKSKTMPEIMGWVILAMIPGVLIQSYFFGIGNIIHIVIAIITVLTSEAIFLKLRKRPILHTLKDGSALLTGIILAIAIPSLAPWWIVVIGCSFAIVIVKQLYGGLGQNIFNPAMAGYVLLSISFPEQMTAWLPIDSFLQFPLTISDQIGSIFTGFTIDGHSVAQLRTNLDGVTSATPLDFVSHALKSGETMSDIFESPMFSILSGKGVQWINIGFLFGGLILLYKRIIFWYIPFSFLISLTIFSLIAYAMGPDVTPSPVFHLFSGATMLGAFFILTDPVTASTTVMGRIIYASLAAFLVFIIRTYGGYPDAVAFAVLLSNICVTVIDLYTKPSVYGKRA